MVECNLTSSSSSTPLSPLHSNRNPSPSNPHRWSNKHPLEYTLQLPLRTRQRRLHIDRPVPGPLDDQLLRFRPPSIATFVTSGTMPSFSHRRSLAAAWICRITSRMIALSIEICLYSCSARCPCDGRPFRGVALQAGLHHVEQPGISTRHAGQSLRQRRKGDLEGALDDREEALVLGESVPGRPLIHHLVENAAQRPHVGGAANLRGRAGKRPRGRPCRRQSRSRGALPARCRRACP